MDPTQGVITQPEMRTSIDDVEVRAHLRNINNIVEADPDSFMQSCRKFGKLAWEHMPAEEEVDVVRYRTVNEIAPALGHFLINNYLRQVEFDQTSDDAIYDHPGVQRMTRLTQTTKNPEIAKEFRDSLSALKLYLYAKRVRDWQTWYESSAELEQAEPIAQNGAA